MGAVVTKIMRRPAVEVPGRRAVPAATKKAVLARSGGVCEHPGCTETQGLEWEHRVARGLAGADDPANIELICTAHHSQKTPGDVKRIAKAKRQEAKSFGEKKPSRMKSRPFPKGAGKQKIASRGFDKRKPPKA